MTATPSAARSRAHERAIIATVRASSVGNPGAQRLPARRIRRLTKPMDRVVQWTPPVTLAKKDPYCCKGLYPVTSTPERTPIWPAIRVSPSPVRNPSRTAEEK